MPDRNAVASTARLRGVSPQAHAIPAGTFAEEVSAAVELGGELDSVGLGAGALEEERHTVVVP